MGVKEGRHKDKERLERTDDAGLLALKMEEETITQGLLVTSKRSAAPRDHFRTSNLQKCNHHHFLVCVPDEQ